MEEQVVWSSVEVPYLVTHNTVSGGNNELDMESLSQQGKQLCEPTWPVLQRTCSALLLGVK